jgi:hypothetical protein
MNIPLIDIPIPVPWLILFLMPILPFLLGIRIFWSGKWRLPVFVAGTVILVCTLLGIFEYVEVYMPPEKRRIIFQNIAPQSDIYCNGVYLGRTPLDISVDELVAKVPEWTTPPEQYFYSASSRFSQNYAYSIPTYTWFPCDDFRKERFLETRIELTSGKQSITLKESEKQIARFESGCRYWWRFENNKSRIFIKHSSSSYYYETPFEKLLVYMIPCESECFSAPIHAWVLANVLGELTAAEKNAWDRHVLKHWQLLAPPLTNTLEMIAEKYRSKNPDDPRIKIFETAFDSTARLKYGLSDPPTEEECRQLLANWVNESASSTQLFTTHYVNSVESHSYEYEINTDYAGISNGEGPLIDAAIRLMSEAIQKPLIEQWKTNHYRDENAWTPLLYIAKTNHNAEYFNEFVRQYSVTHNGLFELLENQNEQVIPLFKTLLYQNTISTIINRDHDRYARIISFYHGVKNPLLEPVFREYIAHVLSEPKLLNTQRKALNQVVTEVILNRISRENIDKNELAVWVASLPLPQLSKDYFIQNIRWKSGEPKSFSNFLDEAASRFHYSVATKMTVDEVNRWFAENPNRTLEEFYETFAENFVITQTSDRPTRRYATTISDKTGEEIKYGDSLRTFLIMALLKINTPETQKTLKQIFKNDIHFVLNASYQEFRFGITDITNLGVYFLDFSREIPDFVLDVIATQDEMVGMTWAPILATCPSPKVEQILEKWTHTKNNAWKQIFLNPLKTWRKRKEIQEHNKEMFHNLVEEKIIPDDLLVTPNPWIWKDGKYVQVQDL